MTLGDLEGSLRTIVAKR